MTETVIKGAVDKDGELRIGSTFAERNRLRAFFCEWAMKHEVPGLNPGEVDVVISDRKPKGSDYLTVRLKGCYLHVRPSGCKTYAKHYIASTSRNWLRQHIASEVKYWVWFLQ